ncbi:hypothetical protein OROHE_019852 [Orobanche hederae]
MGLALSMAIGVVSGIALPSGSDKLYTGSNDVTVRVWDFQYGQGYSLSCVEGRVGMEFFIFQRLVKPKTQNIEIFVDLLAAAKQQLQSLAAHKLALKELEALNTYLDSIEKDSVFNLVLSSLAEETQNSGPDTILQLNQKKYQMLDMFAFVDPAMIGGHTACGPIKKKVEYLTVSHWVLTIIDPENEKVYYLDPIRRRLPLGSCEWKTVVNSAIGKYSEYMRSTSLKAIEWKPITGVPHQNDAIQCGYYVMRYMRDIVEDKDQSNFVTNGGRRDGGLEYTQAEIDVVRNE